MSGDHNDAPAVAAVDLGATSGRVIVGRVADGVLHTRHVHRFANDPVRTRDGLHWNLLGLYQEVVRGLAMAERDAPGTIASIGIDSWAVDYGLLCGGRLLGVPYHYRDERTARGVEMVHETVDAAALYRRNGLQHLDFNTVFQLATEGELLGLADRMLLIPDLFAYWLTGAEVSERTNASTTGLVRADTGHWDLELADQLGVPRRLLAPMVEPGVMLGTLNGASAQLIGRELTLHSVASHDTASAVAAIPATTDHFAYISCGTWGLVGLELDAPVLSDAARHANFTNEGGLDGTTRFLHNVMGLWLLSETLRHWEPAATDAQRSSLLGELIAEAAKVPPTMPTFDVNSPAFLPTGDIPARIREWYRQHEAWVPETRPEMVRCIIESLAEAFAQAIRAAERLANREVEVIHLVGGGSQNVLLCEATARRSGLRVVAGPTEATAMGNLLVQARALGHVGADLNEIRSVVARSADIHEYQPTEKTW